MDKMDNIRSVGVDPILCRFRFLIARDVLQIGYLVCSNVSMSDTSGNISHLSVAGGYQDSSSD